MDRSEAIAKIRAGLKARSGKAWSVTGGRGTSWGWLKIDAPPARCTWEHRPRAGFTVHSAPPGAEGWEEFDSGRPGHNMSPAERAELASLLGLSEPVHIQGVSIPASSTYWAEYVDRAEGRVPAKCGEPYWD